MERKHLLGLALVGWLVLGGCSSAPPHRVTAVTATRCEDLPPDPELAVLYTNAIAAVDPIGRVRQGSNEVRLEGALVRIRDVKADEAVLGRALACHAARTEVPAITRVAPKLDPLRPPGGEVEIAVARENGDLVLRLTSRDREVAKEILNRSRMLAARP